MIDSDKRVALGEFTYANHQVSDILFAFGVVKLKIG